MDFQEKPNYSFDDLIEIVKILRAPGGCPWDRAQTHKSIRSNFIEETYEAVEAIDTDDTELLREELGDVLLQVALHCEMEREADSFDINDVCDSICKKLVKNIWKMDTDTNVCPSLHVLNTLVILPFAAYAPTVRIITAAIAARIVFHLCDFFIFDFLSDAEPD